MRLVTANQATASKRRVYFHLVDATDGITAETGEAGGQPQISTNGGAWTNTGIGTLTSIGNGRYYADLTQATVGTAGDVIETRYKSSNTAECPGDSVQVLAVDLDNATSLGLSSLDATISSRSTLTASDVWSNATRTLSAGTNIQLAKGTGITGFNDLSAGDVRSAIGLASANLDTQLDNLPTAAENADAFLNRNINTGSSSGRLVKDALKILRNRFVVSSGTLTVYEENDTTPAWTSVVTSDAAADPIVESNPT